MEFTIKALLTQALVKTFPHDIVFDFLMQSKQSELRKSNLLKVKEKLVTNLASKSLSFLES